ncbi:dihydroorotase [Methylohalobius crimeensis]|uniref:dihydroorotase n=1 Tax=Methylohalobius crimeensis TaxID=244365 RepID=UPI0003B61548|nr:dihydroorotase [Methylohalobius crimeensis]
MSQRIAIVEGRLLDPASDSEQTGMGSELPKGGVYVADGRIIAVGDQPVGFQADEILDAEGSVISPGFIDLSVFLGEPGYEHKATVATETAAAAKAGITTLCCSPETDPVIDTPAVVELIRERAELSNRAKVVVVGALTRGLAGELLSEMHALKLAGCMAVSNGRRPLANPMIWRRALEYAATYGLPAIVRPQERWLSAGGCVHEGAVATRLGLPGIPASAETVAVAQILALVEDIGAQVHFACLSTRSATGMIAAAKQQGLPVSADVAAHQLHLTEAAVEGFDPLAHVQPPLRSAVDRDGLREAVAAGAVTAICSDHQPHEADAKRDVFAATEPGIAGLEILLPLTLRLVDEGVLSLSQAIARLTIGPAQALGLAGGRLTAGAPADLCVFDPGVLWEVGETTWLSQGRNTPYWGQPMKGRVRYTLVDGRVVYRS